MLTVYFQSRKFLNGVIVKLDQKLTLHTTTDLINIHDDVIINESEARLKSPQLNLTTAVKPNNGVKSVAGAAAVLFYQIRDRHPFFTFFFFSSPDILNPIFIKTDDIIKQTNLN